MNAFNQQNPNKKSFMTLWGCICLVACVYLLYRFHVSNLLSGTVHSLLNWNTDSAKKWHVLAIGLVPIYMALLIFGSGIVSFYMGTRLQRWLSRQRSNHKC